MAGAMILPQVLQRKALFTHLYKLDIELSEKKEPKVALLRGAATLRPLL
jgi:hypothetical protein